MMSLSVLLPVGPSNSQSSLTRSVNSVLNQTHEPDEIILITNTEVDWNVRKELEELSEQDLVTWIHDEDVTGLGGALHKGLLACQGDLVARMDADDVSISERFETQIDYIRNEDVDIVGSYLGEFTTTPDRIDFVREVPLSHEDISRLMGRRCPINHPTVMFRRDAILNAGGYRHVPHMEDWELWARCLRENLRFGNINKILVKAEGGTDLLSRRGGLDYAISELRMQYRLYQYGIVDVPAMISNIGIRVPPRLAPLTIRKMIYERFARKKHRV